MKRIFALLFFAAAFAVTANAQRYGSSTCGLIPGPCMERAARQAYAPADYMINNYGYGYGGGYGYYGNGRSMLVSAASGAIAGGLVAAVVSHRSDNRITYAVAPDGGQYYAEPQRRQAVFVASKSQSQKPLDCRKPRGKRGKNETACAAVEAEATAREQGQEAERQALATTPFKLYNRAGFLAEVSDGDRELGRMRVNQVWRVLEPSVGYRAFLLVPDFSGAITKVEARIRPSSDFQGWVITSPRVEE